MSAPASKPKPLTIILRNCGLDDFTIAARAARYGLTEMPNKEAILTFGSDHAKPTHTFFIRRNKASITVWKE